MSEIKSETVRLTMAQALVKYLQLQYSERDDTVRRLIPGIFGIFGHGNVPGLSQALYEYGQDLPYYQPCNEQSMVHTATGFAKANHRLATLACTTSIGPGATNMLSGAALAAINRLPVLLLPSDYYATRYQGPVLQQLEHPISADVSVNDCFRPLSRFFDRICRPEQLLTALPEAMRVLTDPGDTGPVTLSLPQDVQAHAYDYPVRFFEKRVWRIERRLPHPQRIQEAVGLLKDAKSPMILAGGGVHYGQSWDELQTFAETFGIPVAETKAGKGSMRQASSVAIGGLGSNGNPVATKIAAQADVVFCVGTRLTDFITGSRSVFQHPDVKFVGVNVCGFDAFKHGALPILADSREALKALTTVASEAQVKPREDYLKEVAATRQEWCQSLKEAFETEREVMSQTQLVGVLNQEAQEGDTVIAAAGAPPGDLHKLWDVSGGKNCHIEFGYSCMGYELPAGLGVRMAQPSGEVYVFIGDGTYLMNPTELVTALQEKLKITLLISENHGYQCIRWLQEMRVGHPFGNELRERDAQTNRLEGDYVQIDFAKNAESMGAKAWHVYTPDELRSALREAREEKGTCVIVAETDKDVPSPASGVWWDFSVAEVSGDPVTQELYAKYEQERKSQRFYY